jgi:hypothetical protein
LTVQRALEEVRDADEAGDELGVRVFVDLGRRSDLLDLTVIEDRDPVAHRERLFLVVSDVDERDADFLLDALQLRLHVLSELQVERAERLVQQEHLRAVHDRAGERDPLALPAGELGWLPALETAELDELECLGRALRAFAAFHALDPHPVADVLADRHVREQRVVLKDGVHVSRVRRLPGHVRALEQDPALVRGLEAGDQAKRRGLPRARRAEHREELAGGDFEVDAVDGDDVSVRLRDRLEAYVSLWLR